MAENKKDEKAEAARKRQTVRRKKLKNADMHIAYVRGKGGYFDESVRTSLAVKNLVDDGLLPIEILKDILKESIECIPPKNNVDRIYLKKIMSEFLRIKLES